MTPIPRRRWLVGLAAAVALISAAPAVSAAQRGQGRGGMMMHDPAHGADMAGIHALFERRAEITRTVTVRPDGVETITESANPEVARLIQAHVASMLARVKEARPIHQRDPLYREIFAHAGKIEARTDVTANGVRVVETSTDPYVAKLIQAHAEVVGAFLVNGHAEAMKNHEVPAR